MKIYEFLTKDALDEAAPENARSIAIYNTLAHLRDSNPKELKQKFITALTAEFPHLSPHRANAWLGFANKAYKAQQTQPAPTPKPAAPTPKPAAPTPKPAAAAAPNNNGGDQRTVTLRKASNGEIWAENVPYEEAKDAVRRSNMGLRGKPPLEIDRRSIRGNPPAPPPLQLGRPTYTDEGELVPVELKDLSIGDIVMVRATSGRFPDYVEGEVLERDPYGKNGYPTIAYKVVKTGAQHWCYIENVEYIIKKAAGK